MTQKNLAQIAKGGNGKNTGNSRKKVTPEKKETTVIAEKPIITPEEERNLKAKETVEKLLEGVDLIPKKEGVTQTVTIDKNEKDGIEWFEEQAALLSEQVENLKLELAQSKEDYTILYQELQNKKGSNGNMLNETIVQNILLMFNELQNNLTGRNPERTPHDIVKIEYLLKQMMTMFPFTEQYRRF